VLCIWSRNYGIYYCHSCGAKYSIHLNLKLGAEPFTSRNFHILVVCSRFLYASRFSVAHSKPIYNSKNRDASRMNFSYLFSETHNVIARVCVTHSFEGTWALMWTATIEIHGLMLVKKTRHICMLMSTNVIICETRQILRNLAQGNLNAGIKEAYNISVTIFHVRNYTLEAS
jgi:hypothetical protein